jgi:major membrane immunogen (membrane-anchored lipoprotein)
MTKRILSFALVAALMVVAFTGCAKKAAYVDGTYVGFSTPDDRSSIGYAKITDATLQDLQLKTTDNYQYPTSLNAWATLDQSLLTSQDVTKVDAVAQATGTSNLFKEAATDALALAANK